MKLLTTLLSLSIALTASATGSVDLQGTTYNVDTLRYYDIASGLTHIHLKLTSSSRLIQAYVIDWDRELGANIEPKVEIGRDSCNTAETVTSMGLRHTNDEYQYLAGINGDFFITSAFAAQHEFGNAILGYPNMSCFTDGKIVAPDIIDKVSRENALIIGEGANWWIDATDLRYLVLNNDGSVKVDATAVNYPRRDEEMVVYNSYMGRYTKTSGGRELCLRPAEGAKWGVNKSVKFIVDGNWTSTGNSPIPDDGIVISCGPKYANDFIDNLKSGDIVKLKIVLSLPAHDGAKPTDIREVIGGDVRILNQGVTTTEAIRWINTPTSPYSRSLVGFDKERRHMYICSVDAGYSGSSGVSYFEAADLMRFLGCWDALDLDGGGSTAMWTRHGGIINHLRDGSERAVGNALYFRLKAAPDNHVNTIKFTDRQVALPQYAIYSPIFYGYNAVGQLIDTSVKGIDLVIPEGMGRHYMTKSAMSVSGSGRYTLGAVSEDGKLSAEVPVFVDNTVQPKIDIDSLIVDNVSMFAPPMISTLNGITYPTDPTYYTWTADNPEMIYVDVETARLKAIAVGETRLTGESDINTVTLRAICQPLDTCALPVAGATIDPDSWKITRASVDKAVTVNPVVGNGGMTLDFKVTSTRGARLTLTNKVPQFATPDSIELTIEHATIPLKNIILAVTDATGQKYSHTYTLNADGSPQKVALAMADLFDTTDPRRYPVSLHSITLTPAKVGNHHVAISHFNARYSRYHNLGVGNITADDMVDTPIVTLTDDYIVIDGEPRRMMLVDLSGRVVASSISATRLRRPSTRGLYLLMVADTHSSRVVKLTL